jgi:hypothetical protein
VEISRTSTMTQDVDYWNLGNDLGLIKLNSPILTINPIPVLTDCSKAASKPCVAIEMDRHLNRMIVESVAANASLSLSVARTAGSDNIEGGDSGKPVVCIVAGLPVLIIAALGTGGVNSGTGSNASHYINEINAILAAGGEELTLWNMGHENPTPPAFSPNINVAFPPSSALLAYIGV